MNGVIRYRLRLRQVLLYVVLMLVPVAQTSNRDNPVRPLSAATVVMWVGLLWLSWRRFGVELRPEALVLYGFRRQVIPWTSIDRVDRSTSFGTTYLNVHVDGRRRRLRAPQHTPILCRRTTSSRPRRRWSCARGRPGAGPAGWCRRDGLAGSREPARHGRRAPTLRRWTG